MFLRRKSDAAGNPTHIQREVLGLHEVWKTEPVEYDKRHTIRRDDVAVNHMLH